MGRKKASGVSTQQVYRPFCFFCDRTFDDETVLLQHQRAKHFRCPECDDGAVRGKCESVQGLIVHTLKVHGKSLARVPNALQGRDNPELNVYGMDGIPSDLLAEKGYNQPRFSGDQPAAPKTTPPPLALQHPPGLLPGPPGMPPCMPSLPPGMPGMPGMPLPCMAGMPGMPALPPDMPGMPGMMPPGFPGIVDMTGMPPGSMPTPDFSGQFFSGTGPGPAAICDFSASSSTAPGGSANTGMVGLNPSAGPSLEGFQQFLAQQGLPPPRPNLQGPNLATPPHDGIDSIAASPPQRGGMADSPPQRGSTVGVPPPHLPPEMPAQSLSRGFSDGPPGNSTTGFSDGPAVSNGPSVPMLSNSTATPEAVSSKRHFNEDNDEDVSVEEKRARLDRYRSPR